VGRHTAIMPIVIAGVLRLALVQAASASCARRYARQEASALCGNDAVAVAASCITPPRVIDKERECGASPRSSSRHVAVGAW